MCQYWHVRAGPGLLRDVVSWFGGGGISHRGHASVGQGFHGQGARRTEHDRSVDWRVVQDKGLSEHMRALYLEIGPCI